MDNSVYVCEFELDQVLNILGNPGSLLTSISDQQQLQQH